MAASEERRAGERDRQKFQLANAASGRGGLTKVSGGRPTAGRKHQAALQPQTPDERHLTLSNAIRIYSTSANF